MSSAQALIAKAKQNVSKVPKLKPLAVEHLRELCEYNDGVSGNHGRVSALAAIESLKEFGWTGAREALDRVCREQLGRANFARAK